MAKKLGRSLKAGDVTVDEIRKLTKAFAGAKEHFRDDPSGWAYDTVVVDGDLEIKGDFITFKHALCGLVVRGNLRVTGLYQDFDDPSTGVFVTGSLEAARVITAGTLSVMKSLVASEAVVGFYNDYGADIGGDLVTPLFAPENHAFNIKGNLKADVVLGRNAQYRVPSRLKKRAQPLADAELQTRLVPEILEIIDGDPESLDIELNDEMLRERVMEGKPILKSAPAATAKPMKKLGVSGAKKKAKASNERCFEFVEGSSRKFWAVTTSGAAMTTRYGKIGSDGQSTTKKFSSPATAKAEVEKLIKEKLKKGYRES